MSLARPRRSVPRRNYLAMADVKVLESPTQKRSKPGTSPPQQRKPSAKKKSHSKVEGDVPQLPVDSDAPVKKNSRSKVENDVPQQPVDTDPAGKKNTRSRGEGDVPAQGALDSESPGKKKQAVTPAAVVKKKVKPAKTIILMRKSGGEIRRSLRLDKEAVAEELEKEEKRREESTSKSLRLSEVFEKRKTTESILAIMPICEPRRKQRKEKHIVRSDFIMQTEDTEMTAKLNFLEAVGICMPQPDSEPDTDLSQVEHELVAIVHNNVAESLEGEASVQAVMDSIEASVSSDSSEDTMSVSEPEYIDIDIDDIESPHEEERKVKRKEKPVASTYSSKLIKYSPVETGGQEKARVVKKRVVDENRERKFKCTYCSKAFFKQPHLNTHMIIHTGSKPFECPICSKRFTQLTNLQTHKARIHFGEKRFKCEYCGRRFSELSNVLRHEKRVHSLDRKFTCNVCKYRFKTKDLLRKHYECKHTEKGFQCRFCKKKFSRKSNMHQHISMAHTEKLYSCRVCSKDFSQRGSMLVHQMAKHCYFNVDEQDEEDEQSHSAPYNQDL